MPDNFFRITRFEAVNTQWISGVNHPEKQVFLSKGEVCDNGEYDESFIEKLLK